MVLQATLKEIKAAYKQLAFTYHPDRITTEARCGFTACCDSRSRPLV